MRAMKRTVSVLLSLMLVLGMMTIGMSAVSAAETNSIQVTSNLGTGGEAQYTENSEQVTVTFKLKTNVTIVNTQSVLTFDPTVLKIASTNTAATVMPNFSSAVINLTKTDGRLPMNWSNHQGTDAFNGTEAVYAVVVFDILKSGVNTTVNLDVSDLNGSTNPQGGTDNDVKIIDTYEEFNDTTRYTATVDEKVTPEEGGSVDFGKFLYTYMGNFEGKVGLIHFFYAQPEGYDPSTLTVKFDGPLDEYNKTMKYTDMTAVNANISRYDYFVYSVMFSQPISVSIYQGDTLLAQASYSIEKYIEDKLPNNTDTKMVNFYKAVLNYGAYAQVKFDMYADDLANKNIDSTMATVDPAGITLPAGVGELPDVSAVGIDSLYDEQGEYLDDTRIRQFYVVSDADKLKPATVAGPASSATANFEKINNYVYQLIIPNIGSADLDELQTVTYGNGAVYKTTMMARVKQQLAKADLTAADKNFFTALYWYNQTANAYFNK